MGQWGEAEAGGLWWCRGVAVWRSGEFRTLVYLSTCGVEYSQHLRVRPRGARDSGRSRELSGTITNRTRLLLSYSKVHG